jgi:hypothetical protein
MAGEKKGYVHWFLEGMFSLLLVNKKAGKSDTFWQPPYDFKGSPLVLAWSKERTKLHHWWYHWIIELISPEAYTTSRPSS